MILVPSTSTLGMTMSVHCRSLVWGCLAHVEIDKRSIVQWACVQEENDQQPSNEQTDDAEEVRPVSCIAQPVQRLCIAYCVAVSTDMNSIRARMVRTRMAGCSELLDSVDVNAYTHTHTHTHVHMFLPDSALRIVCKVKDCSICRISRWRRRKRR